MESRLSPAGLKSLVGHSLRRTIGPVERLCGIETDAASMRAIRQRKEDAASVLNQRRRRANPRAGPGDVERPRRRAKKILAALVRRPGDGEGESGRTVRAPLVGGQNGNSFFNSSAVGRRPYSQISNASAY